MKGDVVSGEVSIGQRGGGGRRGTSGETMEQTKELFKNDGNLSIRVASNREQFPPTKAHHILGKGLFCFPN